MFLKNTEYEVWLYYIKTYSRATYYWDAPYSAGYSVAKNRLNVKMQLL